MEEIKIITSKDNKLYKKCYSLGIKKYRDKLKEYIIEGEKLVKEAIFKNIVKDIIIERGRDIRLPRCEVNPVFMEGKLFRRLTHTETTQGVIAIVKSQNFTRDEFFGKVGKDGNILIIDRVQDPGNVGTMIRTAKAGGYKGVIIIRGSADIYSPKVIRAASNAVLDFPIFFAENEDEVIEFIKDSKRILIGTDVKSSNFYYQVDTGKESIGLIIGNEGRGVSTSLLEKSDFRVKIPMALESESLNASVAAGILIYHWKEIIDGK